MLSAASAWLDSVLSSNEGEPVEYARGEELVDGGLTAVVGATPIGFLLDSAGGTQSWQTTDFQIAAADLVIGGELTLPQVGDRIVRRIGGQRVPFEVLNADDRRCFRYVDGATRATLRVHTKEIHGREDE